MTPTAKLTMRLHVDAMVSDDAIPYKNFCDACNSQDVGGLHVHYVFWGKGFVPKDCAGDDSRSIEFKGEGR
jgi:hypothetical protein